MIEVRLYHMGASHHLADIPLDQIDTVIPTIKRWGVWADQYLDTEETCGQFVHGETGAYFEVRLG